MNESSLYSVVPWRSTPKDSSLPADWDLFFNCII